MLDGAAGCAAYMSALATFLGPDQTPGTADDGAAIPGTVLYTDEQFAGQVAVVSGALEAMPQLAALLPSGGNCTASQLADPVDALIADNEISEEQKPSLGCNIKWKE